MSAEIIRLLLSCADTRAPLGSQAKTKIRMKKWKRQRQLYTIEKQISQFKQAKLKQTTNLRAIKQSTEFLQYMI